jgi:hypothetical protein
MKKIKCQRKGCRKTFWGTSEARYCPDCRYIVSHTNVHRTIKPKPEPVMAHCPSCQKDYSLTRQEAKRYAVVNGKIYRFCEKCDYKRNQYEPEEKRVIW